nr:T9SS type A sorting domain-containing protein [Hymenobacter sp. 15J16-1T3B]
MGAIGVGLDIAKNTTGSLLVHTAVRQTSASSPTLLVYTLPAVALAANKAAANELAVYPQPATEAVTIRTAGLQGQLTLLDGLGRVMRELPLAAGQTEQQLPLQGLTAGVYVLRATDKHGRALSTRLSKQ